VWGALAAESADIEALAVFPDLRRAYDEGFIDPRVIGRFALDDVEASAQGAVLESMKERNPPIDDVAEATSWWARFGTLASHRRAEELAMAAPRDFDDAAPVEPYRAPPKVGRNEPCPCGSGKKFKKCCGG
jgi:SEC-C motif-containing protein